MRNFPPPSIWLMRGFSALAILLCLAHCKSTSRSGQVPGDAREGGLKFRCCPVGECGSGYNSLSGIEIDTIAEAQSQCKDARRFIDTTGKIHEIRSSFDARDRSTPTSAAGRCSRARSATQACDSRSGAAGGFCPQCETDGSYRPKQCHGSTGNCWCVNPTTGKEITGTRRGPGQDVQCGGKTCAQARAETQACDPNSGLVGGICPQCETDGSYRLKQCHGSTGNCWCVNPTTGKEITGTRRGPGQDVQCGGKTCAQARAETLACDPNSGLVGGTCPQCEVNGSYKPKQCSGSSGYCWCVDPNSGQKTGNAVAPGQYLYCPGLP